jgi:pimeloyl-ACP methyl ester carboxylesterase
MVNLLFRGITLLYVAVLFLVHPVAHAAEVVNLDTDARFSDKVAHDAMYHPDAFQHTGVYLTQPINPEKEVVVFVHGAMGHPGNFRDIVRALDSDRYQAWMVYYPSGLRVADAGALLAQQVSELARTHGISRVRVFAHSMGGLVAWEMMQKLNHDVDVADFVSVATPWNGHWASRLGVMLSFNPVPSWSDLVPNSDELQKIWTDEQRPQHKLVFALTRDDGSASGDGTISKESQLSRAMVDQASEVIKLIGTHTSVLHEQESVRALVELIS